MTRRASPVDAMLMGTVLLWALNITVTKYMFEHGWRPLAYGTIRYFVAISLFWAFTYWRERSFRIARSDVKLVLLAALMIFLNQLCFVYSIHLAHASTVALLLGTTPIFNWLLWGTSILLFAGTVLLAGTRFYISRTQAVT